MVKNMNGNNNNSGNSMEKMLASASKMLGTNPEKLKSAIEKGAIDDIMAGMNPADAKKLKGVMENKTVLEKLMKSPQAVEFMKQMGKK